MKTIEEEVVVAGFELLSRHLRKLAEENHETPQGTRTAGWDLNPGRPEYEAGILRTRLRCIWERVVRRVIWIEKGVLKIGWRKL